MGRAAADKKSQRTSDKKGRGKDSGKPGKDEKFVPKYEYFAKSKLASYPNVDGVCLHLGKGQDERSFFALKNICQTRSGKNDELCRRLGMGIALDAASAQHGAQLLQKRFPAISTIFATFWNRFYSILEQETDGKSSELESFIILAGIGNFGS